MKKNILVSLTLALIMSLVSVNPAQAQRHLYNRVEFGAGNVWTFVGMEAASMVINQLTHKQLTEATLRFGVPVSEYGNLRSYQGFDDWNYDRFYGEDHEYGDDGAAKFKGRNLLSNIIVGDKVGYLTDNLGFVNWCFYGAAYYNMLQLKVMEDEEDFTNVSTQRLQLGGGVMLTLGSIESKWRFIFDGGLRYNIPLHFGCDGFDGSTSDALNSGISSHCMFKCSWDNSVAVGATVDLLHYNMFKDESICGDKSKMVEFGITLAILFKQ